MFNSPASTFRTFLAVSLGIIFFGAIMVFSAAQVTGLSIGGSSFSISGRQIFLSILSLPVAWVIAQLPLASLKKIAHRSLGLAIIIMLLLIPFGREVNGNTNWIAFGPIDFQPSEVAKILLILWSAYVIDKNFGDAKKIFFQLTFGFLIILAVVLKGGDLGSAVVVGLILATLVYLAGAESKYIAGILAGGIFGVAALIAMQPYRIARLTAFIDPFAEGVYKNAGWQPAHSVMALASGGFFGSGIGESKQKWGNLAEAHTDFIFGVIGEEFGLFGTLATLAAISILVICIIKIALTAKDTFSRYLGLGIAFWIGFQSLINLASATSLIPVVGVTLPFISYGGSSLLALVGALGFVAGIALRNPEVAKQINVRWPRGAK
jgi:cell division protein FtsW